MPVPDFQTGVPPWATFDDLKQAYSALSQRLFNLLCNLDSLNVVRIDAGTVQVYDLSGGSGATITLTKDGLVINDGTTDTFKADASRHVTMTGATVQTQAGYPKVEMDPNGNLLAAYLDADSHITISPAVGGTPTILIVDNGTNLGSLSTLSNEFTVYALSNNLVLKSNVGIDMQPAAGSSVIFPAWTQVLNFGSGRTLQQDIDSKANGSGISGTVYVASTSGGAATTPITFSNGVRTS